MQEKEQTVTLPEEYAPAAWEIDYPAETATEKRGYSITIAK